MRSDEGKNWMRRILFYYQFKLFNIIDGDVRYKERRNSKRPKRPSWDVNIRLTWFCKWYFSFEIRTWFQPVLTRGISRSVFVLIVNVYIYFLSIQTYGPKFTRQLNITNFGWNVTKEVAVFICRGLIYFTLLFPTFSQLFSKNVRILFAQKNTCLWIILAELLVFRGTLSI